MTVLIGSRRRWLRRAAIVLAGIVVLSALSQLLHEGTARSAVKPVVVTRHDLRPGQLIQEADVEVVSRDAVSVARDTPPATGVPYARTDDAVGRIVLRGLTHGEVVGPGNTLPLLEYYGVSGRVPQGMRAVNLVVPSSAAFAGELRPQSRVDILGAFAVGQERAAAALLTSGIVLRISGSYSKGGVQTMGGTRANGFNSDEAGIQGGGPVEVEVAVPTSREREVVLAQAFGRTFLAVHSAAAEASHPAPAAPIHLQQYLEFPPEPHIALPLPPVQTWLPKPPTRSAAAAPRARPKTPSAPGASRTRTPNAPRAGTSRDTEVHPEGVLWTVEVIGGGERSIETVPRASDSTQKDDLPHAPTPPHD